jgi:hypothetical protein
MLSLSDRTHHNFIKDGYSNPSNLTSTTPIGCSTLLSSDKMSNTASTHFIRYTIQPLSHFFGFCSFKNWNSLHDVGQPNFSFIQPTDSLMELGHVANIKKHAVIKL